MRTAATIAALLACACSPSNVPSSPTPRPPPIDTAPLWALAPEGTRAGVVIAPGSGRAMMRGFAQVVTSLRAGDVDVDQLDDLLAVSSGAGFDLLGGATPGYDTDGAVALFFAGDGYDEIYAISPVTDRAAYRAATKAVTDGDVDVYEQEGFRAVCAPHGGYYRCAPTATDLEAWTPRSRSPIDDWPAELRDDVEIYAELPALVGEDQLLPGPSILRAGIAIERGGFAIELEIAGEISPNLPVTAQSELARAALARPAAGVLLVDGRLTSRVLEKVGTTAPDRTVAGAPLPDLFAAFTGEIAASMRPGSGGGQLAASLRAPGVLRGVLARCSGGAPGMLALVRQGERCRMEVMWGSGATPLDLSIRDDVLHVSAGSDASAPSRPTAPVPSRLREQSWLVALWFRGLAHELTPSNPLVAASLAGQRLSNLRWLSAHVTELGIGVRRSDRGLRGFVNLSTVWRNPPELVARLEPLLVRLTRGDTSASRDVEALAGSYPESPLAVDTALGRHGVFATVAASALIDLVGIVVRRNEAAGQRVLVEFEAIKDEMCACRDKACADGVNADFETWLKANENSKGSRAQQERAKAIAEEYVKCMMSASGHAPAAAPDSP